MDETESNPKYPTAGASFLVFVVTMILGITIGSVLQVKNFLAGIYVTEWLLILGPPLLFLRWKGAALRKTLKLQEFKFRHIGLGILAGCGIYFVSIATVLIMEDLLGPYPAAEFYEQIRPTTWLGIAFWILAIAFSAGICEEVLYRGFIQNGLQNSLGPGKALVIASLLFTIAHLDPWRTPAVFLIGLLTGYLLIRTGSLYSAIAVHMTANAVGNILSFSNTIPHDSQWLLLFVVSVALLFVLIVFVESQKRKASP
ncbi:MAG: CPBP family intramembrane metalloprotease [Theionarchaea archaeon]|nr:CPBP family intramembrane metalloprotease [Theionarchaea archaeon]